MRPARIRDDLPHPELPTTARKWVGANCSNSSAVCSRRPKKQAIFLLERTQPNIRISDLRCGVHALLHVGFVQQPFKGAGVKSVRIAHDLEEDRESDL